MAVTQQAKIVEHLAVLKEKLASAQAAEGTRVDDNTWCWVQSYMDFDYEHAYLVDVRVSRPAGGFDSDYLAIFEGFDQYGAAMVRYTWFNVGRSPDLYDAAIWWVRWVKQTRETRMVEMEPEPVSKTDEARYQVGRYYKGVYTPGKRLDGRSETFEYVIVLRVTHVEDNPDMPTLNVRSLAGAIATDAQTLAGSDVTVGVVAAELWS